MIRAMHGTFAVQRMHVLSSAPLTVKVTALT